MKLPLLTSAAFALTAGSAFAAGGGLPLPEPGSLALVGAAVAVLAVVSRKGKK